MEKKLLICGDVHGKLNELVWKVTGQLKLTSANIIVAGDFGVGFGRPNSMDVQYEKVSSKLIEKDITIYAIRGNHDDPSWFTGEKDYDRLKFCQDYRVISIGDLDILPVGGAISIDKDWRIKENDKKERYGSSERFWWEGEDVVKLIDLSTLPKKVDIVVTHEAPLSFEPIILRAESQSLESYEKTLETRRYLNKILEQVNSRVWFYGHYHKHHSGAVGKMLYRCLDELEIYDVSRLSDEKKSELVRNSEVK